MPRAVKDPTRAPITRERVLAMLEQGAMYREPKTAKVLARQARWFANGGSASPQLNERDIEIVHGILRTLKAEGVAETCGETHTDKGSGRPPLLWRLVSHG